ncbi:unnamed protein product [Didymodactylos carnosus]|uniref:Uncharacterized protein n=1 Tax=Didymodactylos carnosus TaxID=1234261 RepID=A0A813YG54_9BILA|nr:unnamed protein product [Didymodactylos carnosus]CAF0883754.1 unnamed protein product [Didymodactylos carnosus]CAF3571464.1 unnamed protein product [Didymodactylos carnosus]CAF3669443.1 unnamed protein product [Didymodactylos carnosus]
MNLEHLEPVQYAYPQMLDSCLDCKSHALVCSFNRLGTLLAVGCLDGNLYIWDFVAKTISKSIYAHSYTIYSLSWSKKSDFILSCSSDSSICCWSTISGYFDKRICTSSEYDHTLGWISTFNSSGSHILTGNARGKLLIFEINKQNDDVKLVRNGRISEATKTCGIRQISVSKRSKCVAILTMDKIRIYSWTNLINGGEENNILNEMIFESKQILHDSVNKSRWMRCCWSGDGEYICAASVRQHHLFVWEALTGSLVKMLEDDRGKCMADVVWHPFRPMIVSISDGILYTFSRPEFEAFPPHFHEIDENIVYNEREDEFDLNDEDLKTSTFVTDAKPSLMVPLPLTTKTKQQERGMITRQLEDENEKTIDIMSLEPLRVLCDDDCDGNNENNHSSIVWQEDIVWVPTGPVSDDENQFDMDNNNNIQDTIPQHKTKSKKSLTTNDKQAKKASKRKKNL